MDATEYFCIYMYDIKSTIKEVDAGSDISILCTSKQKLSNMLKKRLYAFLVGRAREFNTSSNVTAEYFPVRGPMGCSLDLCSYLERLFWPRKSESGKCSLNNGSVWKKCALRQNRNCSSNFEGQLSLTFS